MMYFLLILFFGSLLGIIFMIGRKLVMLQNDYVVQREEIMFEVPFLKKAKHITIKNIKKHSYIGLVATIRFYIRSTNFLKNKYQEVKTKIKSRNKEGIIDSEKKEISKFLKMISEYKHKIREIKHKIKEEENNL
jgi:hypothetical protein